MSLLLYGNCAGFGVLNVQPFDCPSPNEITPSHVHRSYFSRPPIVFFVTPARRLNSQKFWQLVADSFPVKIFQSAMVANAGQKCASSGTHSAIFLQVLKNLSMPGQCAEVCIENKIAIFDI